MIGYSRMRAKLSSPIWMQNYNQLERKFMQDHLDKVEAKATSAVTEVYSNGNMTEESLCRKRNWRV